MKSTSILFVIAITLAFSACKKSKDGSPDTAPEDQTFNPANATSLKQGSFSGNMSYTVSGTVKLYEYLGKKYVYFENFNSSNGPDLKVYLATSNTASQFVSLGTLKGVSGDRLTK